MTPKTWLFRRIKFILIFWWHAALQCYCLLRVNTERRIRPWLRKRFANLHCSQKDCDIRMIPGYAYEVQTSYKLHYFYFIIMITLRTLKITSKITLSQSIPIFKIFFCKFAINSFQSSVVFRVEASHLFCRVKQMTGFYMKPNIGLKWVNMELSKKRC